MPAEQGLIQPDHAEALLAALDAADEPESNSVLRIGAGFLRIVRHLSGNETEDCVRVTSEGLRPETVIEPVVDAAAIPATARA
jgi:hypothetical protein